jgi:hypothetical protein
MSTTFELLSAADKANYIMIADTGYGFDTT